MRALFIEDEKLNSQVVKEIIEICCEDDLFDVKDKEDYDPYKDIAVCGLYMVDAEGDELYIENVSQYDCNKICEEILVKGFVDLRKYGTYFYYD